MFKIVLFVLFCTNGICDEYRLLSGSRGGNWDALGKEICTLFTENGIKTQVSKGGGVSNIVNIDNDGADIGFSVGSLVGAAVKGNDLFDRLIDNIMVLANLYPQVTYFIARKDFVDKHKIKSLKDALKYKKLRIATLAKGTSSKFLVNALFKLGYKTSLEEIEKNGKVFYSTYKEGAKLLEEDKIDIFAFSVGEDAKIVKDIEKLVNVEILPIKTEILTKLSKYYGTRTYILKPKSFKSIKKFTPTIGDFTVLIIRKDMPKDVVRNMSKILLNNQKDLSKKVEAFSKFNARSAISTTLPMSPISRSYFSSRR